ncbi:MAG: peptidase, partial [Patescibacteria group bacterium]
AMTELKELRQLDIDKSGSLDAGELLALQNKKVVLSFGDKMMEALSTHPNMLKRIKLLSTYKRLN